MTWIWSEGGRVAWPLCSPNGADLAAHEGSGGKDGVAVGKVVVVAEVVVVVMVMVLVLVVVKKISNIVAVTE